MNKVKKIKDFLKQHFPLIAVVLSFCFCISTYVYSAYTDTNFVPKTITVHENPGYLFTSDYLEDTGGGVVLKTYSVPLLKPEDDFDGMDDPFFFITLRNYNTNDKTTFLADELVYSVTAQIVNNEGNPLSSVEIAELQSSVDNNNVSDVYRFNEIDLTTDDYLAEGYTFEDKLEGGRHEKLYKVVIDKNHLKTPKYFIKVTATPSTSNSRVRTIAAILGLSWEYIEGDQVWEGKFSDTAEDSKDMDGFNYTITGSGIGTGKLIWDPSYLELDKYTISEYGFGNIIEDEPDNKKSIKLSLDDESRAVYKLRFHRTGEINETEEWDDKDKKESLSIVDDATKKTVLEFIYPYSEPSSN